MATTKPKRRKLSNLEAAALNGRTIWPPMAQAKGIARVPGRPQTEVRGVGGTQTLDVRAAGRVVRYQKIRRVDGPAPRARAAAPDGTAPVMLPTVDGAIRRVATSQMVRHPSAQRQIVPAGQGDAPQAGLGRRIGTGVEVRMKGAALPTVAANQALQPRVRTRRRARRSPDGDETTKQGTSTRTTRGAAGGSASVQDSTRRGGGAATQARQRQDDQTKRATSGGGGDGTGGGQ